MPSRRWSRRSRAPIRTKRAGESKARAARLVRRPGDEGFGRQGQSAGCERTLEGEARYLTEQDRLSFTVQQALRSLRVTSSSLESMCGQIAQLLFSKSLCSANSRDSCFDLLLRKRVAGELLTRIFFTTHCTPSNVARHAAGAYRSVPNGSCVKASEERKRHGSERPI